MMDYYYAKFADCSFSRFGFIMQTNTQTHSGRITQTSLNASLPRLSSAWVTIIINIELLNLLTYFYCFGKLC